MDLKDRVAIVTGGSRGIGKAACLALAGRGALVIACGRDTARLEAVVQEAGKTELPGRIEACELDLGDGDAIGRVVDDVAERHGRIDVLVNNAGITQDGLLANMEDEQFDLVIDTNLRAVFRVTRAAVRHMIRARKGRIINVSSVSGIMGNAGQCNYAASKAGVIGFTKSVAKELARRNITCNVVAPGFIETDMTDRLPDKVKETVMPMIPLRRFGKAEEIGEIVAFLASDLASYMTGQVLVADGGLHM